jgi:hypothetical protein
MIQYSLVNGTNPVAILIELSDIVDLDIQHDWRPGIFKNNYCNINNFIKMQILGIDIDGGFTLEQAKITFGKYRCIIGTTKSHGIIKHPGEPSEQPACDRFRVVFELSRPITSDNEYKRVFKALRIEYPFIDGACSDASRLFFGCKEFVNTYTGGVNLDVDDLIKRISNEDTFCFKGDTEANKLAPGQYGRLGDRTCRFLANGAPAGSWNVELYQAARDYQQQGYTYEDAFQRLQAPASLPSNEGTLNTSDLSTIKSAFQKEPSYPPNEVIVGNKQRRIKPEPIKEFLARCAKLPPPTWLIDGLIPGNGMVQLVAEPNAGKTWLALYVTAEAEKQGRDIILIEEEGGDWDFSYRLNKLRINNRVDVILNQNVHLDNPQDIVELVDLIKIKNKPVVICDPLAGMHDGDENSVQDMNRVLSGIKAIKNAIDDCLVIVCHHTNKSKDNSPIYKARGSSCIAGAMDTMIHLESIIQPEILRQQQVSFNVEVIKSRQSGNKGNQLRVDINLDTGVVVSGKDYSGETIEQRIRDILGKLPGSGLTRNQINTGIVGKKETIMETIDEMLMDGRLITLSSEKGNCKGLIGLP